MSVPTIHEPFTVIDSAPRMAVGTVISDPANGSIKYKYVKFLDAVTYAVGQSVEYANAACTSVTNDRASGSSLGRVAAGIVLAIMTQNSYGFIQIAGPATGVLTSGADDIAVGEHVITHATTDGTVDGVATPTLGVLGIAISADDDTANTVSVLLRGLE